MRGNHRHQYRVTVWLGPSHRERADRTGCAWTVLDDDGLTKFLGNRLSDESRHSIGGATGVERNNQTNWLTGEALLGDCKMRKCEP